MKRSEMIAIIDQEIIDCKVQLQLLKLRLKELYEQNEQKTCENATMDHCLLEDKSVQTACMKDVAIQVDPDDINKSKKLEKHPKIDPPREIDLKPILLCHNREEKYQRQIQRIKQQQQQQRKRIKTRSIATETDSFTSDSVLLNNSFADRTIYMDLPSLKSSKRNHRVIEAPDRSIEPNTTAEIKDEIDDTSLLFHELMQISRPTNKPNDKSSKTIDPSINLTNITAPSIEQSFTNTSDQTLKSCMNECNQIDYDKFWNDVFETAGLQNHTKKTKLQCKQ